MKFYDLHLHSNISVGENSIGELVRFAERLGYSGIAICDNFQGLEKIKHLKDEISKLQKSIEVYLGVQIQAKDPAELKEMVNKVRDEVLIIIVHGGDYNINRAACENPKVDILAHPELERMESGLDEACLNAALENEVKIQINFREILYSYRKPRSYILEHIAENIELCNQLKVPMILCSGAQSIWDMRDPRELVAIANVLGMDLPKAFSAITDIPQRIIEKNKKILEGKAPSKGIEVV